MLNLLFRATTRLAVRRPLQVDRIMTARATNQLLVQKNWAHNLPLTYDFVRERIMLILCLFDKIDPNKLTLDSHFYHDLGLNSLDHVEIIMQIEDDFLFEIPDKDAEHLLRPSDILRYLTDKEEAYKELQDMHAHHGHGHDDHGHGHGDHHHGEHADSHSADHAGHGAPHTDGHNKHLGNHQPHRAFSTKSAIRYAKGVYTTTFREEPAKQIKVEEIQERVMKVCSRYDKIDSSKLTVGSHFVDDLGLDSLDHIEIIMELEDEFGLEIPDVEADKLMRPGEIIKYITLREEKRAVQLEDRPY